MIAKIYGINQAKMQRIEAKLQAENHKRRYMSEFFVGLMPHDKVA